MRRSRHRCLRLVLLLALLLLPAAASAAPEEDAGPEGQAQEDATIEEGVSAWMTQLDPAAWEEIYSLLPEDARTLWDGTDLLSLIGDYALSESLPTAEGALSAIGDQLIRRAKQDLPLLLTLMGVALLSAFAGALSGEGSVAKTAGFVCRCFALTAVLAALAGRTKLCMEGMTALVRFMELVLPALFALLTAMGSVAAVGVFQPATALLCGSVAACMRTVVLPVSVVTGVVEMIDRLGGTDRISGIAKMLKKALKWIIGAITTVYIGVMTISGMSSAGFDGLSIRTAKYAASSMVPVVGGMVSGSFDTVLGCATLVKNAVGTAAIFLSLSIVLLPLVQTVALMFVLRLAAGLSGPVAERRLIGIYDSAADALQYVVASLIAVALMFVVTVGLLMALTNYMTGGG